MLLLCYCRYCRCCCYAVAATLCTYNFNVNAFSEPCTARFTLAENTSELQRDLASAHEIEICRALDEYSRLLLAIKKTIKIRKDAKKTFTDSIAVKAERYQQYNNAMESFADTRKIAAKLEAYNEAKSVMLENRKMHISISKNLISDYHRQVSVCDRSVLSLRIYHVLLGVVMLINIVCMSGFHILLYDLVS